MLNPQFVEMIEAMEAQPRGRMFAPLLSALVDTVPSVGVRVNRRKGARVPDDVRRVPWCDTAFYVDGDRPRFTFDPALHQGLYYVQDPSSTVIHRIVSHLTHGDQPLIYIDACAAPGGKTTAAIDALPDGSFVIANEYDRRRADTLVENVIKWGYPSVAVTVGDTDRLRRLGPVADIIAVDAPCSGEGMMRKDETAVEQWSPSLVKSCAAIQRDILDNAWHALKPGGYLIYSTCTFNTAENEDNVRYLIESLQAVPVEIPLPDGAGIAPAFQSPYPAARFIPGNLEGEGLFVAVVRKPDAATASPSCDHRKALKSPDTVTVATTRDHRKAKKSPVRRDPAIDTAAAWLRPEADLLLSVYNDTIIATPRRWSSLIDHIQATMRPIHLGLPVATIKGRDIIPSQALALSSALRPDAFPAVPLDYPTAIAYLRREAINLADSATGGTDIPRGIVILTHNGHSIGFAKNLGNRANNLYPAPWAIKSTHLPPSPPSILHY